MRSSSDGILQSSYSSSNGTLQNSSIPFKRRNRAFSYIEILFAVAILTTVFYGTISLFLGSSKQIGKMREKEEMLQIASNASVCFESIGYSGFVANDGSLSISSGTLSFGSNGNTCLIESYNSQNEIEIPTYVGSGSKTETKAGSRIYLDQFLVQTGSNFITIKNTISVNGSGGNNWNHSINLYKK